MAATGFTPIQLYRTTTAAAVPTAGNLADGELAINLTDEILYFKNAAGTVKFLSANITPVANGGTGATAAPAARTNLGATTLGGNLFTITNPSAVTFPRFNADNTVSSLSAADFRTAIGAGTGGGSVSSVAVSGGTTGLTTSGGPITSSGTITLAGTLAVSNGGTGATTLTANNVLLGNGTSALQVVAPGSSGNVLTSNGTTWVSQAAGASLSGITESASPFETALGSGAGTVNTGANNTFIGYQAGRDNTSGASNTFLGTQAGLVNSTSPQNVAVGALSLDAMTGGFGQNTAVGWSSLSASATGSANTAIGWQAMGSAGNVNNNVAIGYQAGQVLASGSNVAIGRNALILNTSTVGSNTAVGATVLPASTTGDNNAAFGNVAGLSLTTGSSNTLIGTAAGSNLTTGSNNIIIGREAQPSSATVSDEVTIGPTTITSTRLRGMVELNAAMFEAANISATAATGTINFDARTQSVLYYTSNASANWTLNIRAASGVSLDSVMTTGESMTVAFLVTNGSTAYYQTGFQIDGTSVTPRWQGGTAPTSGNASSIDAYVITVIKTGAATFTALASQTRFA